VKNNICRFFNIDNYGGLKGPRHLGHGASISHIEFHLENVRKYKITSLFRDGKFTENWLFLET